MINKSPSGCGVHGLFMDTGLGRDGYSAPIRRGKIDDTLAKARTGGRY